MILKGDGKKANPLLCEFGEESELIDFACDYLSRLASFQVLPKGTPEKTDGVYTLKFDDEKIYFVEEI